MAPRIADSVKDISRGLIKNIVFRLNHLEDAREPSSSSSDQLFASAIENNLDGILSQWANTQLDPEFVGRYGVAMPQQIDPERLSATFVKPLLRLLTHYLRTANPILRDIYLDERLRYAPHTMAAESRNAFFEELLRRDLEPILGAVDNEPTAKQYIVEKWGELHDPLFLTEGATRLKLLAVGDCLLNELRVFLPRRCRDQGLELETRCIYFSAQQSRGLSIESVLQHAQELSPDFIALSFLTYEGLPFYRALLSDAPHMSNSEKEERVSTTVGFMQEFIRKLRERTAVPILLHNACGLPWPSALRIYLPLIQPLPRSQREVVDLLNVEISKLVAVTPNCLLIDETSVIEKWGFRRCIADCVQPSISADGNFHTSAFGFYLSNSYLDVFSTYRKFAKLKVLCLDFDNTLWAGVMADGEVNQFAERQRLLKRLQEAGIVLVAVSKNDPKNIVWDDMVLQQDDFVLEKINWGLKPVSVAEAAAELSLGLDTFVFIDDNPVERELVESQLPEVRCLDADDPMTWKGLETILQFPITGNTEEARTRTDMYRANMNRKQALKTEMDYSLMMKALGLRVKFGLADNSDLARVGELVQRTNQFNTTTIRYSGEELRGMLQDESCRLYVAELEDKFGRLGVVAVVIIKSLLDSNIDFDTFIMSCRAMGFGLEQLVLSLVCEQENDAVQFTGHYIATNRNAPCSDLFKNGGFSQKSDTTWILNGTRIPERPDWFNILGREANRQ